MYSEHRSWRLRCDGSWFNPHWSSWILGLKVHRNHNLKYQTHLALSVPWTVLLTVVHICKECGLTISSFFNYVFSVIFSSSSIFSCLALGLETERVFETLCEFRSCFDKVPTYISFASVNKMSRLPACRWHINTKLCTSILRSKYG